MVIARGGGQDGDGGDVMFHGRQTGSDEDPVSGPIDLEGDGEGDDGDFGGS